MMGLRFRSSIRIAKGVRLNLGKKSASLSLGGNGMTVNLSRKGAKATFGLPGTGLSYTQNLTANKRPATENTGGNAAPASSGTRWFIGFMLLAIMIMALIHWTQ
jgi:hypothetical protein